MIRLAKKEELQRIMSIINDAKALFKSENSDQWQDYDGYPNEITMLLHQRKSARLLTLL